MIRAIKDDDRDGTLLTIVGEDVNQLITKHTFNPEFDSMEGFRSHYHPYATEWILIRDGEFELTVDDETQHFCLKKQPMTIIICPKEVHQLRPLSFLRYVVIRDLANDATVYV